MNTINRFYASVDAKTTGLQYDVHEVVEIAIVYAEVIFIDGKWEWREIDSFTSLSRPLMTNNIDSKAMQINGIKKDDVLTAPFSHVVRRDINDWWEAAVDQDKVKVLGHNFGGFDKPFVQNFLGVDFYNRLFDYHAVDTWSDAELCQTLGLLPKDLKLNLEHLSEHFNEIRLAHKAIADAKTALDVRVGLLNLLWDWKHGN